jgi:6-phosphogluconolactonase
MNLRIFENLEDLSHAAARTIRQSGAKSIAVTGGSTPKRLYDLLAADLPRDVTWVLVDERYVPKDDPQSNAGMIERTLFARAVPDRWLRFRTELGDPAATARAFEDEWRQLEMGELDLVLLGCGDDGHTASLFPGTGAIDIEDRVAIEVWVPRLEQWRVSITKPVIRAAKQRIVMASGASKAKVLADVREGVRHPITIATEGVETWWFVDRDAASALENKTGG